MIIFVNLEKSYRKTKLHKSVLLLLNLDTTGRSIYDDLKEPNAKYPINTLGRREQVIIYPLRTQHVQLNSHLNRIKIDHPSRCPLFYYPNSCLNAKFWKTWESSIYHLNQTSGTRPTTLEDNSRVQPHITTWRIVEGPTIILWQLDQ